MLTVLTTISKKQAKVISRTQSTVVKSLWEMYANTGWNLVQRSFGKYKYLIGFVMMGIVMLTHPLQPAQATTGPLVNFGGVLTHTTNTLSISSYKRNITISEHIPHNRIQALFYFNFSTPLNFTINYTITTSGGNFLSGGSMRTIDLSSSAIDGRMLPRRTETNYLSKSQEYLQ